MVNLKLHAQHLGGQSKRTMNLSPVRAVWKDLVEGRNKTEGGGEEGNRKVGMNDGMNE